ncbi:MAG: hypothetical protein ACMXYG_05435 [Candidatus Woesearchaeota archaeon]
MAQKLNKRNKHFKINSHTKIKNKKLKKDNFPLLFSIILGLCILLLVILSLFNYNSNIKDNTADGINQNLLDNNPKGIRIVDQDKSSINLDNQIEIIEFKSDKEVYSSREDIKFTLIFNSNIENKELSLNINGIRPINYEYIKLFQIYKLKLGRNEVKMTGTAPYCTTGCGGVTPGAYEIIATLKDEEMVIAQKSTVINLEP